MLLLVRVIAGIIDGRSALAAFRNVHGDVGIAHQGLCVAAMLRKLSDAYAGTDIERLSLIKLGILPRRSSSVCSLTAALVERNGAHGNSDKDKSIVVASKA